MESPKLFRYICFWIKLCNNIKIITENKNYYKTFINTRLLLILDYYYYKNIVNIKLLLILDLSLKN